MEKETIKNARNLVQEAKLIFKVSRNRDTEKQVFNSFAYGCLQLRTTRVEYRVAVKLFFVAFDNDFKDVANKFQRALVSFDAAIDLLARSEAQKELDELYEETKNAMMAV